ncbi:MAG: alcohol dehydrogenase, partial [Thermoprotei archaeon]
MEFTFYSPTRIIFSSGSLDKLGVEACKFGGKALLVTGRTFARKYGYTDKMLKLMKDNGVKAAVFDKVEPNPSFETVEAGAMLALKEKIDFVVAFGGGSAIDAAKAIAVLFSKGGRIRDYIGVSIDEDVIPIIAIPTTCGTGSEVTRYSVLTDVENRKKVVVVGEAILPRTAIIDPTILQHLPPKLIAYTGFDALSHAIESLVSKKSNPMS